MVWPDLDYIDYTDLDYTIISIIDYPKLEENSSRL